MIFNDKYKLVKLINYGSFGILYEVIEKDKDNKHYALKLMKRNLSKEYANETEIMKNLNNKYIIKLKDNFYDKINEGYCIVMELCDGDLRKILKKYEPKGLPIKIINKIFIQLNEALKTMRDNEYTHRDLKPENILIKYTDNTNFDIKLTDFGLTRDEINSTKHNFSNVGTKKYMAPEIEREYYNNKCDLWSLGVILYELYTNKYIFDSDNPIEREINRYKGNIVKETDNEMINKLIRKLIQVDIDKRINWEEYFADQFFKDNNIENIEYEQINIKIKVEKDFEKIKIYNGNEYINEKNIKIIIENEEIETEKYKNNLKKGNYDIILKINKKITNCKEMFKNCKNILEIKFINFDTKNVTDMSGMFYNCTSLKNLDITNFDTKNVYDMSGMFYNCTSLKNLDVTNFDTKNVFDTSYMFYNCISLNKLNLTKFNFSNVKFRENMFSNDYVCNII